MLIRWGFNLQERLKRNSEILRENITTYLDDNSEVDFERFKTHFTWEGKEYDCYATCLFITR